MSRDWALLHLLWPYGQQRQQHSMVFACHPNYSTQIQILFCVDARFCCSVSKTQGLILNNNKIWFLSWKGLFDLVHSHVWWCIEVVLSKLATNDLLKKIKIIAMICYQQWDTDTQHMYYEAAQQYLPYPPYPLGICFVQDSWKNCDISADHQNANPKTPTFPKYPQNLESSTLTQ